MSQKLSGKVAVITGASKGIGASIASHLAAEGAAVVVNYASSKNGAERVVLYISGKETYYRRDTSYETDMARPFRNSRRGGRGHAFDRSVSVR